MPQQALFQWNSAFWQSLAERAARRADEQVDAEPEQVVAALFAQILQRPPSDMELRGAAEMLRHPLPEARPSRWQYGYGEISEERDRVVQFTPYPVFKEKNWRGESGLPDKTIGWSSLNATGGHPGHAHRYCAIRRWVAGEDCDCLLYTSPSPRDQRGSRMPSSA